LNSILLREAALILRAEMGHTMVTAPLADCNYFAS
jgi:hypothetical protein